MQYFYKLIDPPWSWLARQAPPPSLTQTINITGQETRREQLIIYTAHLNNHTFSRIVTLSKIIGLQGVCREYLSCHLICPQLFSFQFPRPENMRHAAPIIQERVGDNSRLCNECLANSSSLQSANQRLVSGSVANQRTGLCHVILPSQ